MFSIIDNEINVNFEILGGLDNLGAPNAGLGTPTVIPELVSELQSLGLSVNQLNAFHSKVEQISKLNTGDSGNKVDEVSIVNKDIDTSKAIVNKLKEAVEYIEKQQQNGGSLNDALSKDIQIKLIGGANVGDALWDFCAGLSANVRFNIPAIRVVWDALLALRIGSNAVDDEWRPEQSTFIPEINEFTRRTRGKLEVKVGNNYVSLMDYFDSAKNGNLTQKQLDGRAGANWVGITAECFASGASIWKEDGVVQRKDCLAAINNTNLWKTTAAEVAKMHPKTVFDILKSLGFKGVPSNKGVKCQSYESWVSSLKESQKTTDPNKNDEGLVFNGNQFVNAEFIKNLVAYINANPAILNKGDLGVESKSDTYGVKPATWNKRVDHSFDDLRYNINNAYDTIRFRVHGLAGAFPAGFMTFTGGAVAPAYLFPTRSNNRVENLPKFSAQLRSIFKSLESRLKANNKTLGQTTKDDIERIFKSLEKHEESAVLLIKQLESYYLTTKGDRGHAVVSNAAMAKALENFEKNMHKLRKRAINVIDIQTVLNTAVRDAESAQSNFGAFQE